MILRKIAVAAPLLAVLTGGIALADQAHVRAGPEEGQAVLFRMGGNCFGLTPQHVMTAGDDYASLVRRDPALVTGEAVTIRDLGNDLALIGATGGIAGACGAPFARAADIATAVQDAGGRLRMRHVFEDGTTAFREAEVVVIDATHIVLREVGDWAIAPSDSGSAVMVGDRVVGMVQSVGGPEGTSLALRWDYATHLLAWEVERGIAPPPAASAQPALGGVRIEHTNARPLAPDAGPEVLLAPPGGPGAWHGEAVAWPVEIVLAMPEGAMADIRGLAFHPAPGGAAAHPRNVEIQRTRATEGDRSWSSYASAVLNPGEARDTIDFAGGMQARRLRLLIHDTWGGGNEIALGRIEVITAE